MERLTAVNPAEYPLPVARPQQQGPRPPLVWLIGSHGGAGTSFLSASLAFADDAKGQWPAPKSDDYSPAAVLVARETTTGLDAAEQALRQWHTDPALAHVELLGLVIVAVSSGKKLGKDLVAWKNSVGALAPKLWDVDWIPQWQDKRMSELAEWWPEDAVPEKKKQKKYTGDVPGTVALFGADLFETAKTTLIGKD